MANADRPSPRARTGLYRPNSAYGGRPAGPRGHLRQSERTCHRHGNKLGGIERGPTRAPEAVWGRLRAAAAVQGLGVDVHRRWRTRTDPRLELEPGCTGPTRPTGDDQLGLEAI